VTLTHHPFGPSSIESYSPLHGGCYALVPAPSLDSGHAEAGSRGHEAALKGDLSVLEGDGEMEALVLETREFIAQERRRLDGEEFYELRLELGGVNFGTCDYLRFNERKTNALLIDLKFGYWTVSPAYKNLQILNYVTAAFETFPSLKRILAVIYHARSRKSSFHWFGRRYQSRYRNKIEEIVRNATRCRSGDLHAGDFTPDAVTCGFCARISCPARIQLASALINAWQPIETPVSLPEGFSLTSVSLDQLGALKRLTLALKAFCDCVDAEAKRRAIDEGKIVEGYELKARSGKRSIIGNADIGVAVSVLDRLWRETYPGVQVPPIAEIFLSLMEIGVGDIEKQLARSAPKGRALATQKLIGEALDAAHISQSQNQYYLAAVKI